MSSKRGPDRDLNKDNFDDDANEHEEIQPVKRATDEELATRHRAQGRRRLGANATPVEQPAPKNTYGMFAAALAAAPKMTSLVNMAQPSSSSSIFGQTFGATPPGPTQSAPVMFGNSNKPAAAAASPSLALPTPSSNNDDAEKTRIRSSIQKLNSDISAYVQNTIAQQPLSNLSAAFDDYARYRKELLAEFQQVGNKDKVIPKASAADVPASVTPLFGAANQETKFFGGFGTKSTKSVSAPETKEPTPSFGPFSFGPSVQPIKKLPVVAAPSEPKEDVIDLDNVADEEEEGDEEMEEGSEQEGSEQEEEEEEGATGEEGGEEEAEEEEEVEEEAKQVHGKGGKVKPKHISEESDETPGAETQAETPKVETPKVDPKVEPNAKAEVKPFSFGGSTFGSTAFGSTTFSGFGNKPATPSALGGVQPFTFGTMASGAAPLVAPGGLFGALPAQGAGDDEDAGGQDDGPVPEEFQKAKPVEVAKNTSEPTGEEGEVTEVECKVKLHVFADKEWKAHNVGTVKVNYNASTNKTRVIMRAEGVGKLMVNSYVACDKSKVEKIMSKDVAVGVALPLMIESGLKKVWLKCRAESADLLYNALLKHL